MTLNSRKSLSIAKNNKKPAQKGIDMRKLTEITQCKKVHGDCGHKCGGVAYETSCLPCLQQGCNSGQQNLDDLCNICYTEELGEEPCIQLPVCNHLFHAQCIKNLLKHRWSTLRITFDFLSCPICKVPITNLNTWPQLRTEHKKLQTLKDQIAKLTDKALQNGLVT